MVYVPAGEAYEAIQLLHNDSALRGKVAGLLVGAETPEADSPDSKFPLAAYMPYKAPNFTWNPHGTPVLDLQLDLPLLLLDNTTGPEALARAAFNEAAVRPPVRVLAWACLPACLPGSGPGLRIF